MTRHRILFVTLLLCTILLPLGSEAARGNDTFSPGSPRTFTKNKTLSGDILVEFSVVTLGQYKKDVDKVFEYTFSETERIAQMFSHVNTASEVTQVEAAAGKNPVTVSNELLALAKHANEIRGWTRKAFNPVNGPGKLKINKKNSTLYLTKTGSTLNLKGILEGFIADLYIRAAYHANLDDALVRVNGVTRSMGKDAFGPWQLMVEGNGTKTAKHGMRITISNYSAATVKKGTNAPTINPRNGKPVTSPFYSVTILTKQAATAQAVANSVFIMGEQEGEYLIDALGVRGILGYPGGKFEKIGNW